MHHTRAIEESFLARFACVGELKYIICACDTILQYKRGSLCFVHLNTHYKCKVTQSPSLQKACIYYSFTARS